MGLAAAEGLVLFQSCPSCIDAASPFPSQSSNLFMGRMPKRRAFVFRHNVQSATLRGKRLLPVTAASSGDEFKEIRRPVRPPPIFVFEDKEIQDGLVQKPLRPLAGPSWPPKMKENDELLVSKARHQSGYVALVGLPNAGKSTLLNRLIGQKLSIVTQKPQTTRHRILGICSEEDYQMILYDTPGVMGKKMHKLDDVMMQNVRTAAINADCVFLIVDITQDPEKMTKMLGEGAMDLARNRPSLLVLNKRDLLKPGEIAKRVQWYEENSGIETVMAVSAKRGQGAEEIKQWVIPKLPYGPAYYPKDIVSEHPERFFVAEIVREKIFLQYREEIPYACQVNVPMYVERRPPSKDYIEIEIIVEKTSQKGILLGKAGQDLKTLATASRLDIEDFVGRDVFLEIRVKVEKNWRQDEKLLQEYGLDASKQAVA